MKLGIFDNLKPRVIELGVGGPQGPRGPQGVQGEMGPPGASGVSDDINVEVLTGDKYLTAEDAKYQYLDPGENDRTVTLPSDADKGKVFVIRHIGDDEDCSITINTETVTALEVLHQGSIKSYVYDGTVWRGAVMGTRDSTDATFGLSFGSQSKGYGGGVALGREASGTGNALALGDYSEAQGRGLSVGNGAISDGNSISIGNDSETEQRGVAIGNDARADYNGFAIGHDASATENGVAFGNDAEAEYSGLALGSYSAAYHNGIAIGQDSEADQNGVSLGHDSESYWNSIAIGHDALATKLGVAIGYSAESDEYNGGFAKGAYAQVKRWNEETKAGYVYEDEHYHIRRVSSYSTLTFDGETEEAGWHELFLGAQSGDEAKDIEPQRLTIDNNTACGFSIYCTAMSYDLEDAKRWKLEGLIKNNGLNTALVGTPTVTILNETEGAEDWDIRASVDDDALCLEALGFSDALIRYVARCELEEVGFPEPR